MSGSRYELLEKIGSGSYATVYRARDLELNREVAVKQLHTEYREEPERMNRYWQEARLLASMQHPNIVTIYDIVRDEGWLVMELMQATLTQRMVGRQMDLRSLRTTLAHCLRALKYLHERGIVHGDVKPSNMMIDARKRIKIGDFGLARRVSDADGSLLKGTTKYMAPEVVSDDFGDVGPASDLYSLGFSAFELMCGDNFESLFPGLGAFGRNNQVAWMMWHAAADRRLPKIKRILEGVPEDLAHVIETLIEKDQSKRYRSADEALADLHIDAKPAKPSGAPSEVEEETVAEPTDGKRRQLAVGAFAISVILSLVVAFVPMGPAPEPAVTERYGIVREVLPGSASIVIEDPETRVPEELSLGNRPRIFLNNEQRNILLRELQPGDRILVDRSGAADERTTIRLIAERPVTSQGIVHSLNTSDEQVVVEVSDDGIRERITVHVSPNAPITINGAAGALRDLQVGDRAEISHLMGLAKQTNAGRMAVWLNVRRLREAAGFVEEVLPEQGRLTVKIGTGRNAELLSLPVAEDCSIELDKAVGTEPTTLAQHDLRVGDHVHIRYDVEFRELKVTRDLLRASGTIAAIDLEKRQVTVTLGVRQDLTVRVPETCEIRVGNAIATFDLLRDRDPVEVLYSDPANEANGELARADLVDAMRPIRNDRWAIVIGNQAFSETFLTPMSHLIADANLIRDTLVTRYAVNRDRMRLLLDADRESLQLGIVDVLRVAGQQTQVVVYVNSPAYLGTDDKVYLAGSDFRWDDMSETGWTLEWLIEQLDQCEAKEKLLLFDGSHLGRGKDLERQPSAELMFKSLSTPPRSTVVIGSCAGDERGLLLNEGGTSLFAHSLARGFSGYADTDRNLWITPEELFGFLTRDMGAETKAIGRTQHPVMLRPVAPTPEKPANH